MALHWLWSNKMGTMEIESQSTINPVSTINIYKGNCLAIFIHEWHSEEENKGMYQVISFFLDRNHAKRILKGDKEGTFFDNKVVSLRLNLYYKESKTLLDLFTKNGIEVTAFYQKP